MRMSFGTFSRRFRPRPRCSTWFCSASARTATPRPCFPARRRWTAAPFVEQVKAHRLTLTLPILNRSACVLFLASGAAKSGVLKSAREETVRHPFQRVRPRGGRLVFFIDRAAAAHLETDGG